MTKLIRSSLIVSASLLLSASSVSAQSAQRARGSWTSQQTQWGLTVRSNGPVTFSLNSKAKTFTCSLTGNGTIGGTVTASKRTQSASGTLSVTTVSCSGSYNPTTGAIDGDIKVSATHRISWTWEGGGTTESDITFQQGRIGGNVAHGGGTIALAKESVRWTLTSGVALPGEEPSAGADQPAGPPEVQRVQSVRQEWERYRAAGNKGSFTDYIKQNYTKQERIQLREDMLQGQLRLEDGKAAVELAVTREAFEQAVSDTFADLGDILDVMKKSAGKTLSDARAELARQQLLAEASKVKPKPKQFLKAVDELVEKPKFVPPAEALKQLQEAVQGGAQSAKSASQPDPKFATATNLSRKLKFAVGNHPADEVSVLKPAVDMGTGFIEKAAPVLEAKEKWVTGDADKSQWDDDVDDWLKKNEKLIKLGEAPPGGDHDLNDNSWYSLW